MKVLRKKRFIYNYLIVIAVVAPTFFSLGIYYAKQHDRPLAAKSSHLNQPKEINPTTPVFIPKQTNVNLIQFFEAEKKKAEAPPNCAVVACIALTFDDGPDPAVTPPLLDVLHDHKIKATFFLVGNKIADNVPLLQRIARAGHELGNHTWDHHDLRKMTPQQVQQEVNQTQDAVSTAGLPPPTIFRPPYEFLNNSIRSQIQMPIILWNIDPKDWHETDPSAIADIVRSQAKPGAIVVMHDTKLATVVAVKQIITDLSSSYKFVTVSELLNLSTNARGEFYGR